MTEASQIGAIFSEFFSNLFISSSPQGINQCFNNLPPKVFDEDNFKLFGEFIEQEINEALFMMIPLGALGPDSFSAHFYQKFWGLIGQ